MTPDQAWLSKSSMLTTSPACSARHSSSRIVRSSTRAVSPSREIWPDAGLTHQAPMRSIVAVGRSIEGRLLPAVLGRRAALADYTTPRRNADCVPAGLLLSDAT